MRDALVPAIVFCFCGEMKSGPYIDLAKDKIRSFGLIGIGRKRNIHATVLAEAQAAMRLWLIRVVVLCCFCDFFVAWLCCVVFVASQATIRCEAGLGGAKNGICF